MPDLLVRLYDLPHSDAVDRIAAEGIIVRRALAPERDLVLEWIRTGFWEGWAGEAATAFSHLPTTIWIAVRGNELLGFACHDATAKAFFGPTGVAEQVRGKGIGEALLFATLQGMAQAGYAYAVIGDPGPVEFYRKRLDAIEIPGSEPGIYAGMLRR